jgi:hypothetical protein
VAQRLRRHGDTLAASELSRATQRASRRATRARLRMLASSARALRHLAAAAEDLAAAGRPAIRTTPKPRPPFKRRRGSGPTPAQERVIRLQTAQMYAAHAEIAAAKARDAERGEAAPCEPQRRAAPTPAAAAHDTASDPWLRAAAMFAEALEAAARDEAGIEVLPETGPEPETVRRLGAAAPETPVPEDRAPRIRKWW